VSWRRGGCGEGSVRFWGGGVSGERGCGRGRWSWGRKVDGREEVKGGGEGRRGGREKGRSGGVVKGRRGGRGTVRRSR